MSHHLYHTSGFILGSSASGEANRVFRIFTREVGLVYATAQGVRYLKSKLRYGLQDYSFVDVSLVRGREVWRVTGASKRENILDSLRGNPELCGVFGRVFALLDRLLSGEEKNELLWQYLEGAMQFATTKEHSSTAVRHFEYILVLRILSSLGYLGQSPETVSFVESPYWSDELLLDVAERVPHILGEINKSLRESQL
ncbi:MAG: recombination protein O N-terminal domain-containing protein [Candidatus Taylorbacteria bacterium]|nr:recombination protein O N-terminal domain-containing protein [Candidatus Taylorbacteria bacterium]